MPRVIWFIQVKSQIVWSLFNRKVEPFEDLYYSLRIRDGSIVRKPISRLTYFIFNIGSRPEIGGTLFALFFCLVKFSTEWLVDYPGGM